jgi:hypothetical protein
VALPIPGSRLLIIFAATTVTAVLAWLLILGGFRYYGPHRSSSQVRDTTLTTALEAFQNVPAFTTDPRALSSIEYRYHLNIREVANCREAQSLPVGFIGFSPDPSHGRLTLYQRSDTGYVSSLIYKPRNGQEKRGFVCTSLNAVLAAVGTDSGPLTESQILYGGLLYWSGRLSPAARIMVGLASLATVVTALLSIVKLSTPPAGSRKTWSRGQSDSWLTEPVVPPAPVSYEERAVSARGIAFMFVVVVVVIVALSIWSVWAMLGAGLGAVVVAALLWARTRSRSPLPSLRR